MKKKSKGLLAERLIALRQTNGMTATQCAAELGVSIAAWSQWERAIRDPSLTDLPKICWMFSVSMDELFGLSDKRNHRPPLTVSNNSGVVAIGSNAKATVKTETKSVSCLKCPYKKLARAFKKLP